MNQEQIVNEFLDGATEGRCSGGGNLYITGNLLIHYKTAIAERETDFIIVNVTRYSVVTGRIQKMIRAGIDEKNINSVTAHKVPRGSHSLTEYVVNP